MKLRLIVLIGLLFLVASVSALDYGYTSEYPPGYNDTYVKATSSYWGGLGYPWFAFDPSTSLTGIPSYNAWFSGGSAPGSQKLNVDLGEAKTIRRIYYENYHNVGNDADMGAALFKIYGSNTPESFNTTTYANLTGWTEITPSQTHFDQHVSSDTVDPQYITLTNTVAYRYYSIAIQDNWLDPLVVGLRRIELQTETNWEYSTPGTYYWVCPDDVTTISLNIGAGGGGGKGAYSWYTSYYIGHGGSAGDWENHATVTVTPGTNYTIVVGAGGAASPVDVASNDGEASSAFTYTVNGGTGGLSLPAVSNSAGGNGENGLLVGGNAAAGGSASTFAGGLAGSGYSAGGGGGASGFVTPNWYNGAGGKGSDGYVGISKSGDSTSNTPDFVGTPLTGSSGTLVTFLDYSTITDSSNITYLWNFGDGSTSSTIGNVNHVYSYYGSFTVSLTITSDSGSVTEEKDAYINLVALPNEFDLKTEPKAVQFHVQTVWGAPLVGANVSILGISTSTGNWDWLPLLLGIPLDEVALNDTEMYQITDSLGNAEFLMVPSAKYNVSTTLSGYTFPLFYVVPHDERYTIISNINGTGWFESGNNTLEQVNITVTSDKINNTIGRINVSYNDAGLQTTGGTLYIYTANATRGGADVLVGTMPITSNNFTNSTNVTFAEEFGGQSYTVSAEPIGPGWSAGAVTRTFVVWFKGKTVELAGFDDTILMWLALFIIIFTAMFSGATHAPQVAIIICIESWVFYAMGWFDQLTLSIITPIGGGDAGLIMLLSLATFAAVVWNFREGKRREKGT